MGISNVELGNSAIGAAVHFILGDGQRAAAIIVGVHGDRVNLKVFSDGNDGIAWVTGVPFDAKARPGTWCRQFDPAPEGAPAAPENEKATD